MITVGIPNPTPNPMATLFSLLERAFSASSSGEVESADSGEVDVLDVVGADALFAAVSEVAMSESVMIASWLGAGASISANGEHCLSDQDLFCVADL